MMSVKKTKKEAKPTSEIMTGENLITLTDPLSLNDMTFFNAKDKVIKKRYGLGFIRVTTNHGRNYYTWVEGVNGRQRLVKHIGVTLPRGVRLGPVAPDMAVILRKYIEEKEKLKNERRETRI